VIRLVNDAADEVHRNEAKHNGWIKGARYLWLKNLQNFNEEERPRSSGWRRPISTPYSTFYPIETATNPKFEEGRS
jgi:hypothetical protein